MENVLDDITRRTIEKGTDIGFKKEEIKNTPTEDLLTLKKSILFYLKSKKLKKRNANFVEVYQRINDEIKERKDILAKEVKSYKEGFVKVDAGLKRKLSLTDQLSTSTEESYEKKTFLNRKQSVSIEIDIPSFLNDKKNVEEVEKIKKIEESDKPHMKKCITDFGKGLFDEKFDFDPSDNMDSYKIVKKPSFDHELKEIEIKSIMFNSVPEDMFFTLD